jgi:ribosomal protein S18 acetylase RimI-like enzyme
VPYSIDTHDSLPAQEAQTIDEGLGEANDLAAPLHEVQPLSCFAKDEQGQVIGGAIGRRWGTCCELQQLWVKPAHRRLGLGAKLVRAFETRATEHGCTHFYLETFNFQAPGFYASLGYTVAHEHSVYPHGITKLLMVKQSAGAKGAV